MKSSTPHLSRVVLCFSAFALFNLLSVEMFLDSASSGGRGEQPRVRPCGAAFLSQTVPGSG